jgi:hypothetical protein
MLKKIAVTEKNIKVANICSKVPDNILDMLYFPSEQKLEK